MYFDAWYHKNCIWKITSNPLQYYQDGPYIHDILSYNEKTIRESLLNAICHRSYLIHSDVVVKQSPESLEFLKFIKREIPNLKGKKALSVQEIIALQKICLQNQENADESLRESLNKKELDSIRQAFY